MKDWKQIAEKDCQHSLDQFCTKTWTQITEKDCKHFLDHPAQKIGNRLQKKIANISFITVFKSLETDCRK